MTRLAEALRLYLASKQIHQKQLAKLLKTNQSTITRFLSGENMPEAVTMMRLVLWMLEVEREIE